MLPRMVKHTGIVYIGRPARDSCTSIACCMWDSGRVSDTGSRSPGAGRLRNLAGLRHLGGLRNLAGPQHLTGPLGEARRPQAPARAQPGPGQLPDAGGDAQREQGVPAE